MTGVGNTVPRAAPISVVPTSAHALRANPLVAILALVGLIVPTELSLYPGGIAFTPGRVGIILLFFPSLFALSKRGTHLLMSDFFVCVTAAWMIGAAISVSDINALWSAPGGESLEFFASYLIARAFFFGPESLAGFIRVLKVFAFVAIMLAMGDFAFGRYIVHDTLGAIVGVQPIAPVYRESLLRVTSTFEHPILFGAFCSLIAAVSLYWERNGLQRLIWVSLCFVGCIISITSAALLSFFIVLLLYAYDQILRSYSWRWTALIVVLVTLVFVVFLVTNAPLGWLITHLTFDPESGYFRILIWDAALTYISQAPVTGYAFNLLHHDILDHTVDSVWLVSALRYGIPMIVFLFLANVAAFWPIRKSKDQPTEPMSTAFTIVLAMFIFMGLTVHFWNFMWIFWGLCIGIRASLREYMQSGAVVSSSSWPLQVSGHKPNLRNHRRYEEGLGSTVERSN